MGGFFVTVGVVALKGLRFFLDRIYRIMQDLFWVFYLVNSVVLSNCFS